MFLFKWFTSFLSFLLLFYAPLCAQETQAKELPKETIVENKDPYLQNPEKVTVISKQEIENSLPTLTQVLKKINGFRINESGGIGQYANAFIRGGSSQHIKIYIDGVSLAESRFGISDLSRISLSNIESIEVYKGFTPAYLGNSNMGAAINLISNKNTSEPVFSGNTRFIYGSFDSFFFNTNLFENNNKYQEDFKVEFINAENDYQFKNDRGTPYNSSDDILDKKSNNRYQEINLRNNFTKKFDEYNLTFLFNSKSGFQELGGPQNTIIEEAKNTFFDISFTTRLKKINSDNFMWESSLFNSIQANIFSDPLGEVGFSKNHTKNTLYYLGNKNYLQWKISDIFYSNFLIEPIAEWDKKADNITNQNSYWNRKSITTIIEPGVKIWQKKIDLKASFTFQYFNDHISIFNQPENNKDSSSYSYQLTTKYISDSDYTIQSSLGRITRYPTLLELFGDSGLAIGNTNLSEETSSFGEFSLSKKTELNRFSIITDLSLTGFIKKNKNLINYQQISSGIMRPFNIADTLISGFEAECHLSQKYWEVLLQYSYTDPINKSNSSYKNNKQIPGIPQNSFFAEVTMKIKKINFFYRLFYTSKEYFDEVNLIFEDHSLIQDIGMAYTQKKFGVTLEVKNLENKQVEDIANYPLPGRSFWLKLNIPF